jgi:hypothetical protein
LELIEQAIPAAPVGTKSNTPTIAADNLGAIFDIEIDETPNSTPVVVAKEQSKTRKKTLAKKIVKGNCNLKKSPGMKGKAIRTSKKG